MVARPHGLLVMAFILGTLASNTIDVQHLDDTVPDEDVSGGPPSGVSALQRKLMDAGKAERRARVELQECQEGLLSDTSAVGAASNRLRSAQMARQEAVKTYHRRQEDAADAEQAVATAKLDLAEASSKARPRRAAREKALQEAEARLNDARVAVTAAKSAQAQSSVAQSQKLGAATNAAQAAKQEADTLEKERLDAKVKAEQMALEANAALKRIPDVSAQAAEDARQHEASLNDAVAQKELASLRGNKIASELNAVAVRANTKYHDLLHLAKLADAEVVRVSKLAESRLHDAQEAQKKVKLELEKTRTAQSVKERQVETALEAKQRTSKATADAQSELAEASEALQAANEGGMQTAQLEMREQLQGVKMAQAEKEAKRLKATEEEMTKQSQVAQMAIEAARDEMNTAREQTRRVTKSIRSAQAVQATLARAAKIKEQQFESKSAEDTEMINELETEGKEKGVKAAKAFQDKQDRARAMILEEQQKEAISASEALKEEHIAKEMRTKAAGKEANLRAAAEAGQHAMVQAIKATQETVLAAESSQRKEKEMLNNEADLKLDQAQLVAELSKKENEQAAEMAEREADAVEQRAQEDAKALERKKEREADRDTKRKADAAATAKHIERTERLQALDMLKSAQALNRDQPQTVDGSCESCKKVTNGRINAAKLQALAQAALETAQNGKSAVNTAEADLNAENNQIESEEKARSKADRAKIKAAAKEKAVARAKKQLAQQIASENDKTLQQQLEQEKQQVNDVLDTEMKQAALKAERVEQLAKFDAQAVKEAADAEKDRSSAEASDAQAQMISIEEKANAAKNKAKRVQALAKQRSDAQKNQLAVEKVEVQRQDAAAKKVIELQKEKLGEVVKEQKDAVMLLKKEQSKNEDTLAEEAQLRLTAVSQVQAANAEKELNQQAERALEETARSASHEVEDANMAKEVAEQQRKLAQDQTSKAKTAEAASGVSARIKYTQAKKQLEDARIAEKTASAALTEAKVVATKSGIALEDLENKNARAIEETQYVQDSGEQAVRRAKQEAKAAHATAELAKKSLENASKASEHSRNSADAAQTAFLTAKKMLKDFQTNLSQNLAAVEQNAQQKANDVAKQAKIAKADAEQSQRDAQDASMRVETADIHLVQLKADNATQHQEFASGVTTASEEFKVAEQAVAVARDYLKKFDLRFDHAAASLQTRIDAASKRQVDAAVQLNQAKRGVEGADAIVQKETAAYDQAVEAHTKRGELCIQKQENSDRTAQAADNAQRQLRQLEQEQEEIRLAARKKEAKESEERVLRAKKSRIVYEKRAKAAKKALAQAMSGKQLDESGNKHNIKSVHDNNMAKMALDMRNHLSMLNSVIRREEEAEIEAKSSYTKAKESGEKKRDSARYEAQAAWERAQDRVERAEKTHQKALFMKMRAEAASRNYTQLAEEHGMRWQEASTKLQMAREQLERKRAQMLEAEHLRGRVEDNANADMYQAKDAVDHARQVFLGHEESLAKLSVSTNSLEQHYKQLDEDLRSTERTMNATILHSNKKVEEAKKTELHDTAKARATAEQVEAKAKQDVEDSRLKLKVQLEHVKASMAAKVEQAQETADVALNTLEIKSEREIAKQEQERVAASARLAEAREDIAESNAEKLKMIAEKARYDSERKEHAIAVESVRVETARQNAQRAFAAKRAEMRSDLCLSDRTCEELRVDLNTSWNQGADQYTCAEEQLLYMGHKGCFGQSHPVLDQSSWTLKGQWVLSQNQDSCSAACSAHGLTCSKGKLQMANALIDSNNKFEQIMSQLGQKCSRINNDWGSADTAPSVNSNSGVCHGSDPGRGLDTFNCDTEQTDTKRLCWCSHPGHDLPRKPLDGWLTASSICKSIGARLCAVDELLQNEVEGGACFHAAAQVWTSQECFDAPNGDGHVVAAGSTTHGWRSCPWECASQKAHPGGFEKGMTVAIKTVRGGNYCASLDSDTPVVCNQEAIADSGRFEVEDIADGTLILKSVQTGKYCAPVEFEARNKTLMHLLCNQDTVSTTSKLSFEGYSDGRIVLLSGLNSNHDTPTSLGECGVELGNDVLECEKGSRKGRAPELVVECGQDTCQNCQCTPRCADNNNPGYAVRCCADTRFTSYGSRDQGKAIDTVARYHQIIEKHARPADHNATSVQELGEEANSLAGTANPGFFVSRYGQQCGSDDQSLGYFDHPSECAKAVEEAGGHFFTFHSDGDCRQEETVIKECPEGWVATDGDFYEILQTPKERPSQCKRRYTGHIVPDGEQPSSYFLTHNQSHVESEQQSEDTSSDATLSKSEAIAARIDALHERIHQLEKHHFPTKDHESFISTYLG